MKAESRQFLGYVICFAAFAFVVWSFYPGLMTADSIGNLTQGRQNSFSDINAPLMSYFLGRLDAIVPGPGLIFVTHLAIFWAAAALFWHVTRARSLALGSALALFGLAPHILAQTVVVWKDVALGVSLFMAVALIYVAHVKGSKIALMASAPFLFYGYAARLNALPAIVPIAIWTGFVAREIFEFEKKRLAAVGIGIAYLVALSFGVYAVNQALTEGKTDHPFQQIYLFDLAAMSVERNEPLFPDYITRHENFSFESVQQRYNERSVADLIFPDVPNRGDRPPLTLTQDAGQANELRRRWMSELLSDPAAYLRHRTRVFAQLIGVSRSVTAPYVADGFSGSPPEFRGSENAGYKVLMKYFGAFGRPATQTLFHRAIVWIVLCGLLVYLAMRRLGRPDWDMVLVLATSSLLFIAAYFPTTPSTEFRYLFWPAIATAVAAIFGIYLLFNERIERYGHEKKG